MRCIREELKAQETTTKNKWKLVVSIDHGLQMMTTMIRKNGVVG